MASGKLFLMLSYNGRIFSATLTGLPKMSGSPPTPRNQNRLPPHGHYRWIYSIQYLQYPVSGQVYRRWNTQSVCLTHQQILWWYPLCFCTPHKNRCRYPQPFARCLRIRQTSLVLQKDSVQPFFVDPTKELRFHNTLNIVRHLACI